MALSHQDRIDAGVGFDWDNLPPCQTTLDEVSSTAQELRFHRERSSHRGIHRFKNLRRLWLYAVNQDFLDEIVQLPDIESLYIEGLTATNLNVLNQLPRLRRLILTPGNKITNLDWVASLSHLESLSLESFNQVLHLDPLASLTKLSALGIEGSTFTPMRVTSLAPVSALSALRCLFITCLRTSDGSLKPLHSLKRLEVLQCGSSYFHDDEFVSLHQALPKLRCEWFDMIERHGSTRAGIKSLMESIS
jgi:hypothetical protein